MTKKSGIIAAIATVLVLAGGPAFSEDTSAVTATHQGVATPNGPGENTCPPVHPNCERIHSFSDYLNRLLQAIKGQGR